MKTVEELADRINNDFCNMRGFWAYGLLKETLSIWDDDAHRKLLNSSAQTVYDIIKLNG